MRILCYGDSNTWGYVSGSHHERLDETKRWTRLLQKELGNEYEIIEEGLSGRTLMSEDTRVGKEGKNGFIYLKPCMETHNHFDIIIVMLGTNELKNIYKNTAEDILEMIKKYITYIQGFEFLGSRKKPKLIISGIPLVKEDTLSPHDLYKGTTSISIELNNLVEKYCKSNNIPYINNNDLEVGVDGVHLTENAHKTLSVKLAKFLREFK